MVQKLEELLKKAFSPTFLRMVDESYKHVGHPENMRNQEMLLDLLIVSENFTGMGMLERHRAIYTALRVGVDAPIHGITIRAYTPSEWASRAKS